MSINVAFGDLKVLPEITLGTLRALQVIFLLMQSIFSLASRQSRPV
jgi:hypothetical protein